jgi:hypothetical protein
MSQAWPVTARDSIAQFVYTTPRELLFVKSRTALKLFDSHLRENTLQLCPWDIFSGGLIKSLSPAFLY